MTLEEYAKTQATAEGREEHIPITPLERRQAEDRRQREAAAEVLRQYQDNIKRSEAIRAKILQKAGTADAESLLILSVECIAAMTGDRVFLDAVKARRTTKGDEKKCS